MTNAFPLALPERHGLSTEALLRFFDAVRDRELALNSFMLLQDGQVTAQMWRAPYRADRPQLLYSLSKSVTAVAVGIAADQGLLSLQDPVAAFFPERCPAVISERLARMTVHHLLSMNTGHRANIYAAVTGERDWVRAFLAQEVECEPGSRYSYNTPATYMLSAILERVTGEPLVDFLMPRFFEPLGIDRPVWETCPSGIAAGGMGLSLTTGSIAKFGQLLLDLGRYNGRQVVSEAYVAEATREQSDNRPAATSGHTAQGYGYQIHLGRRGTFRGDGAFGQLCLVAPQQRIVIAATSALTKGQMPVLLDLIDEHLLDAWSGCPLAPPAPDRSAELRQRLAAMQVPLPAPQPVPAGAPELDGRRYTLEANPEQLARLDFAGSGRRLEVRFGYAAGEERTVAFDLSAPLEVRDWYGKDLQSHAQHAVSCAVWLDRSTLQLTLQYTETPYRAAYTVKFGPEGLELCFKQNVAMTYAEYRTKGVAIPR